ncbi:hypothetical protein STEG23_034939, partial [Scotinomys teguina]
MCAKTWLPSSFGFGHNISSRIIWINLHDMAEPTDRISVRHEDPGSVAFLSHFTLCLSGTQ